MHLTTQGLLFLPTGKSGCWHLLWETGTFQIWFKRPLHNFAYCACNRQCLVLGFPLSVSWKITLRTTDLVELTGEQEASVAVKQVEFSVQYSYDSSIFSISKFCGGFIRKACQNWIPHKNLCFLIKSVIYYFFWPIMHHTERKATKWLNEGKRKIFFSHIFTNTLQLNFCTPRTCQHC